MSPATIRADVWHRYLDMPVTDRPAVLSDLLTGEELLSLVTAGEWPTNTWFAGQAEVDAVETRLSRLERITDVLRKAVKGEL